MSEDRNLLSRWSQRKAAARRGEMTPEPAEEAQPEQTAAVESNEAQNVEGAPADDDMPVLPSIEELTAESDYTIFLNAKVPEALRRAALRKLWTSDPVLANLDGLNDYDEDYNLVDTTITAAQTAYRVGRGYFEEIEDKLEKVDQALGGEVGSNDESQELTASGEEPRPGSAGDDTVGESDAAGDNFTGASRQVASAQSNGSSAHLREQSDEYDDLNSIATQHDNAATRAPTSK